MPITINERIQHAIAALIAYFHAKGEGRWDWPESCQDTDASNLITDLLHFQEHLSMCSIETTLERAKMHFDAEQAEHKAIEQAQGDSI